MSRLRLLGCALAVLACGSLSVPAHAQNAPGAPPREVLQVTGDLYQFRNGGHYGTFLVTSDGIILVDPIATGAASWLRDYLDGAFPGKTVKVVIYSHHDGDHAGGAEAFTDLKPEIVAHENAPRGIAADARVSVMPTRTFGGRTTVTLGDRTVELIELGPGHTDSLIGVRFPEENALMVVDIFSGRRLPFQGLAGPPDVDAIIGTLRRIEAMDFRILLTGHSLPSHIADLVAYRTFLENLRAEVLQARREGQSVDQMKQTITMSAYRDWVNYETWLPPSIENMNAYLDRIGAS